MKINLNGALLYFPSININPNYSGLARCFRINRHEIKYIYVGMEKEINAKMSSELDKFKKEIEELLSHAGVRIKAAYRYIKNKYSIRCSYNNFKIYVRKNKLLDKIARCKSHLMYETDLCQQPQVDWGESLKLAEING